MERSNEQVRKARTLRRWMTTPERVLWHHLRNRKLDGWKFRRKSPVGPSVVDFFCPEAGLVVEISGPALDRVRLAQRDAALQRLGLGVLRFPRERVTERTGEVLREIGDVARARRRS